MNQGLNRFTPSRHSLRTVIKRNAASPVLSGSVGEELQRHPLVRDALVQLYQLAGLTIKIQVPADGGLETGGGLRAAMFCRQAAGVKGGCPVFQRLQTQLFQRLETKLKAHHFCCPTGVVFLAVPVVVAGKHVATMVGGKARLAGGDPLHTVGCGQLPNLKPKHGRWHRAWLALPTLTRAELTAAIRLLQHLAQLFAVALPPLGGKPSPRSESARIAAAKRFVRDHLTEPITTRQSAQIAGVTNSHFCRLFRQGTGKTFHDYLATLRVAAAQEALANTLKPVGEIALAVGFQSIPDFNRVFKRQTQMAPSQYRREHHHYVAPEKS